MFSTDLTEVVCMLSECDATDAVRCVFLRLIPALYIHALVNSSETCHHKQKWALWKYRSYSTNMKHVHL